MNEGTHSKEVSQYYNQNTRLFNMFGKTGGTGNIHASLWGPGVLTSTEASNFTNRLILNHIQTRKNRVANVLDLGCGTGASLSYLCNQLAADTRLQGVTLSTRQANRANRLFLSSSGRVEVHVADFHHLPDPWTGQFDVAFAIESFVHSDQPESFFLEAKRILKPTGDLILIDTFPEPEINEPEFGFANEVTDYQQFWKAGNVLYLNQIESLANRCGFEIRSEIDLTDYVEKDRLRDRWIARYVRTCKRMTALHPYLRALRGGNAVQAGFRHGWLTYRQINLASCSI